MNAQLPERIWVLIDKAGRLGGADAEDALVVFSSEAKAWAYLRDSEASPEIQVTEIPRQVVLNAARDSKLQGVILDQEAGEAKKAPIWLRKMH
jgi:hypothetical protein